jgi:hypothetical protein
MKCLTFLESNQWCNAASGISVSNDRHIWPPRNHQRLMLSLPVGSLKLSRFAARLSTWLVGAERMLWLSHWNVSLLNEVVLFDRIRASYGEVRPIIESPGHLFETRNATDGEVLIGLIFLTLAFNWEGYIVASGSDDHLTLGDECLVLSSCETKRLSYGRELAAEFDVQVVDDIVEAWKRK